MLARFARGLLLAALIPGAAVAQPPADPVVVPITADPLATPPLAGRPEPAATAVLADAPCPPATGAFDVIAGFPLAVRYQHRIGRSRLWGEAGVGLLLIVPDAFLGVRMDLGLYEGRRHSFWVRPGIDAHVAVWPFGSVLGERDNGLPVVGGVALDADLIWRHELGDGHRAEFGLKLGVITIFNRNGALPLPILGVLCGYRF